MGSMCKAVAFILIAGLGCGGSGGAAPTGAAGGGGSAGRGSGGGGVGGGGGMAGGGGGADAGVADGGGRDWSRVEALLQSTGADAGVASFGLTIWDRNDQRLYEHMIGGFTADTRVAVASSSKMVSGPRRR